MIDDTGTLTTYYQVPLHEPVERAPAEWASRVREALAASVKRHLMSDVPVGVLLSGGLDSSIIAALARQHIDGLHSFAVGFEGAPDLEAARRVASHLGTTHHERVMSREDLARSLPEVVRHMEHFRPELIRHAIPTWHAAKLAREHVKVVLVGEGADELFGGYSYYKRYLAAGLPNLLHRELHRSTAMLHSTNLLRVDRMTMAHGLEARVPFLSTALVDLAMQIPVSVRLRADAASNNWVEKWILRAAFDDLLPKDILWRPKTTFSDGSGVTAMVEPLIEAFGARELAQESARRYPEWMITSDEEAMYHRLLVEAYGHNRVLRENCYSWAGDILRPAKKSKQKRSVWQRVRRLWTALRRSA
jgi:asparagine synthase (glutamine-hydrolysing)